MSLLVPNPARRMSVEQALKHPWLAGGWTGDIDGVSIGSGASAIAGAPAPTSGEGRPASPSSAVASTTSGSKIGVSVADARLIGKDMGRHQPGAEDNMVIERDFSSPRRKGDNRGSTRRSAHCRDSGVGVRDRVQPKGVGVLGQGHTGGWRGWAGGVTPEELLSYGSLPSTTSYP